MESFRNKYVIHEESGHPGRREFSGIVTPLSDDKFRKDRIEFYFDEDIIEYLKKTEPNQALQTDTCLSRVVLRTPRATQVSV